jgi:hypothetical protein
VADLRALRLDLRIPQVGRRGLAVVLRSSPPRGKGGVSREINRVGPKFTSWASNDSHI